MNVVCTRHCSASDNRLHLWWNAQSRSEIPQFMHDSLWIVSASLQSEASHLAGTTEKQRWHVPSQQSLWQEHNRSECGLERLSRIANTLPRKAVRRPCATWMRCERQNANGELRSVCKRNWSFWLKAPLLQKRMHLSYWRQIIQACCSLGICHLLVQKRREAHSRKFLTYEPEAKLFIGSFWFCRGVMVESPQVISLWDEFVALSSQLNKCFLIVGCRVFIECVQVDSGNLPEGRITANLERSEQDKFVFICYMMCAPLHCNTGIA